MEKIIIVWEKEALNRMDIIKNIIASNATEILIITPESPDYEEIVKKANGSSVFILNDATPEKLKKEISEEFNKVLEPKPQKILDENVIIDEAPRYDKFIKKWNKYIHQPSKPNSKKKWNKRK